MSYNINDLFVARNSRSGYQIEQSLRFNNESENVYLSKTFSSDGNRKKWTWSAWIKLGRVSDQGHVFEAYAGSGDIEMFMRFNSNDSIRFGQFTSTAYDWKLDTTAKFRDPSAWYHVILVFDSDNATSSDRARIYVNGERITAFDSPTYPGSGSNGYVNKSGYPHYLCNSGLTTRDFGGYLAEVNFIDGTAVTDALDFGEYDDNGVWRPIQYAGSYTGNSFYLKFDAADVDGDSSGLGNDFTATGVTTSGTGTDVMDDTPTTNWCTWNPINSSASISLTEGSLKFGQSSNDQVSIGTQSMTSGKYYWEIDKNSGENPEIGIIPNTASVSNQSTPSATAFNQIAFLTNSSNTIRSGSGGNETVSGLSAQTGAGTIGIAVDMDAHKIWWSDTSGNWFNSGDPAAGTNEAKDFTGLDCANGCIPYIYMGTGSSHTAIANFGQRAFAYTPPTGFSAINTSNLPAPTIKDGSDNFNPVIYAPDGSSSFAVTGVGFQPDLVWIKSRNYAEDHQLNDAVRGATKALQSNLTNAETTQSNGLTSFDSDGFTVGNLSDYNYSGDSIISWNWLAGNGTSSNTDGDITSTVSANPTAGFSIITYTGNGTGGATVGHGLGVAPSMVIFKNRDGGEWIVYNKVIGATKNVVLSAINRAGTYSGWFNDTEPTSTVLSLGSDADVNRLNDDIVAYCFAEVENYSKFSSYTGNGSATNGPFVYCGFRPAMVIIKNTTTNSNWIIRDSARSPYNFVHPSLYPNLSDSEINNFPMDFLSNGFKIRDDNGVFNTSGDVYIFMCIAENPFGGDGVSPATAR